MTLISFDYLALLEKDLGPGKPRGRWMFWPCPEHDDRHPSFAAMNGHDRYPPIAKCFASSCGFKAGPIKWLMKFHKLSYEEAQAVVNGRGPSLAPTSHTYPVLPHFETPPGEKWQIRAWQLIHRAQKALWENKEALPWPSTHPATGELVWQKATALEYLLARGLNSTTLHLWQVGYIPQTFSMPAATWGLEGDNVYMSKGILLPYVVANQVWTLKIRRPFPKPQKYTQIRGSLPAIYLVQTLEGRTHAVFCEGELDALLLWQETDPLAGVVSLGSAGNELNVATWGYHFLHVQTRLIAYDLDQAGQAGVNKLAWLHPHALTVPQLNPHDKDLTDFFLSGGKLRSWLIAELEKIRPRPHSS